FVAWFTDSADSTSWPMHVEQETRKLYDELMAPLRERLSCRYAAAKRIILVPNQGLNLLPLHACWWDSDGGGRRFFLDEYDILYAPSCQVLKRCIERERRNGSLPKSLFAVQNPDGSLACADWEVEEASRLFPAPNRLILKGHEATKVAVEHAILFGEEKLFSCRGMFDRRDVAQSHLKLHGDDRLAVTDILSMAFDKTRLVIMSAGETGLSEIHAVEEYQGLTSAFLIAGAQTVIASLWPTNDFVRAILIQRLHCNLYKRHL